MDEGWLLLSLPSSGLSIREDLLAFKKITWVRSHITQSNHSNVVVS